MREWLITIAGGVIFILGFHTLASADEPDTGKHVIAFTPRVTTTTTSTTTTVPPTTTTTSPTTTTVPPTTTTSTTTTTTLPPPPPPPPAPAWSPADECRNISRPVSASAMRWCPFVAQALHRTGQWKPGDLTKMLRVIDCESRGDPTAINPRSSASGLFQHMPRYWSERSGKAAAFFGFSNPQIMMPYDNLLVGVWLFKFGGGLRHWPNCGLR